MTQFCLHLTDDGERTHARLYIYVAVTVIDLKTKYYKDRRGLEKKKDFFLPFLLFYFSSERLCGDNQYCSSFLVLTISNILLKDERMHTSCASLPMCHSG